ncbi:sec-independent translocase [Propionibacterium freudenreichii]|uniref:sec-independent translocase n=1 Tax=Propionibacterium freudenreichii TaxID=1744 RepID=UPI000543484E|nr:sec-independent translocase [Propionibacterium freudenreichii]CEG93765.1 Sec-independent protein translocase protein TatB precursor [Propionibacterium freudenreichii]
MVPLAIFGINGSEFVILAVLAVIFFGPERIPEFSRKAARVVFYVRNIANDATSQLKEELGPEYKDLTVEDLNPKTFVKKHLLDDIQDQISEVKDDLNVVKTELNMAGEDVAIHADSPAPVDPDVAPMRARYGLCFDLEAT